MDDSITIINKDFHEIYFIENHIISSNPRLSLKNNHKDLIGELKKLKKQKYISKDLKEVYIYSIYSFKIYPSKIKIAKINKLEITLELKDEKDIIFKHNIIIENIDKDKFIYDIQFKEKGLFFIDYPPKSYKFTHKEQIKIIVDYLTKDIKFEPDKLLQIIINSSEENRLYFLHCLNEFYPTQEDFLRIGNEEKFKLFKNLLNNGIIIGNDKKNIKYILGTLNNISLLQSKFDSGEIKWNEITFFYDCDGKKNENIFNDRLKTIFLNNEKEVDKIKSYLDKCYLSKNEILNKLNIINEYFYKFFISTEKNNIIEIKNYKEQLISGPINYYENHKKDIDELITKYDQIANKFNDYSKNVFFLNIYNSYKNKVKKDTEKNLIEKAENDYIKLKKIFTDIGIQNFDKNILKIVLDSLKGKNKDEISEELFILEKNFTIEISQNQKDKIIFNIEKLLEKEKIYDIASSISELIKNLNLSKGKLWTFVNEIINNFEKINDEDLATNFAKIFLKDYQIDLKILNYKKNKEDNYLNIIYMLKNKEEEINLLIGKNETFFSVLEDALINKMSLNINGINSFKMCSKFINSLGIKENYNNIEDIIFLHSFQKKVKTFENIELYFTEYLNNFKTNKKFCEQIFDNLNFLKNEIISVFQNSKFILKNEKEKFYEGFYYEEGKTEIIQFAQLNILKNNAELLIKQNNVEDIELYEKFIININAIIKIYYLIKEIYNSGYVKDIEIIIILNNFNSNYEGCNLVTDNPETMILELKNILDSFIEELNQAYKNYPLIRNLYGRQFNLFYEKLYKNKNVNIFPILTFISNFSFEFNEKEVYFKIDEEKNLFYNIERYIQFLLSNSKINLQQLNANLIKDNLKKIGVHFYKNVSDLFKNVCDCFGFLCDESPFARNILLCNEETTQEELTAFLYRAFLCQSNCCFLLSFPIMAEKVDIFLSVLNKFIKEYDTKMLSCLIILISNPGALFSNINNLKIPKMMNFYNTLNYHIPFSLSKVEIIEAKPEGYGRSTHIRLEIERKKRKYIYFPLSGKLTRSDIFTRLKKLNFSNDVSLHIDLFDTIPNYLINEFLFFILINKYYKLNENIFYLPKDIQIIIENHIKNSEYNTNYPILEKFPVKYVGHEEFIIKNNLHNIQIVSNYIKLLKENTNILNEYDLSFENFDDLGKKKRSVKALFLSPKECFSLINKKINSYNLYQFDNFINILGSQLKKFSQNHFFSANYLNEGKINNKIRSLLVNNLIENSLFFAKDSFTNSIKENPDYISDGYDSDEDGFKNHIFKIMRNSLPKNILTQEYHKISFDKMKHSPLFIFQEGSADGFTIISNSTDIKKSELGQLLYLCYGFKIPELRNKNSKFFLSQMKYILNLDSEVSEFSLKNESKEGKETKNIYKIYDDFVFTADNYYKMALILLRLRANIPVIIMGETGCGKSLLIYKLSEMLNKGDKSFLKTLNINTINGNHEIIDFIEKVVISEAKKRLINKDKKILVFLDEINKCDSLGLITELLCNHTYHGNSLPSNIVFIATLTNSQKNNKYPILYSLSNYVLNFANIKENDEKEYITNMIKETQDNIIIKYKEEENMQGKDFESILKLAIDIVIASQNFIKNKIKDYSFSLRDIKRFNIFYKFFFDYFKFKSQNYIYNIVVTKDNVVKDEFISSITLAIFLCYYLRINNNQDRKELEVILNQILSTFDKKYSNFLEIVLKEEMFIYKEMNLEDDIIQTKTLLNCLLALFACINTKTPIFIKGKPGYGKSLSVQLITKAMKRFSSDNLFFKNYPKTITYLINGTKQVSLEEVQSNFKNARAILGNEFFKERIIPLIYFDQIDLADGFPLFTLHEELENKLYEGYEQIAFIGLSNNLLVNTKINCGLLLTIPDDLDIEDITNTSIAIGKKYNHNIENNNSIMSLFKDLGTIYYKYKSHLIYNMNIQNWMKEFHGHRDFYWFIKDISKGIDNKKINQLNIDEKVISSIETNLDGLNFNYSQEFDSNLIKKYYKSNIDMKIETQDKFNYIQKIVENVENFKSRYLLIITHVTMGEFLSRILFSNKKIEYNCLQGSPFFADKYNKEYISKYLQKIEYYMKQDNILILNNLETIYPYLYELFDQNFIKVNRKKYIKMSMGFESIHYSFVNNKFKLLVNIDKDDIQKSESLMQKYQSIFFDRFEKHFISYENLLNKDEIKKAKEIYNIWMKLIQNKDNLQNIFVHLDLEEIYGYIYKAKSKTKFEDLEDKILEKISLVLPKDILIFQKFNGFYEEYQEYSNKIINYYKKGYHLNFATFLKKMKFNKNVIYTFSNISSEIKNIDNIKNELQGEIRLNNIFNIKMSSIPSEKEFEKKINEFMNNEIINLCLIEFNSFEQDFLNYVKLFIEKKEKEINNSFNSDKIYKKFFVLICHYERNFLNYKISLTSEIYQIFIDDLNGNEDYSIDDVLNLSHKFLNFHLDPDLFSDAISKTNRLEYFREIINLIRNDNELSQKINEIVISHMNIFSYIYSNINFWINLNSNVTHEIKKYWKTKYIEILQKFFYLAEDDQFYSTLLSFQKIKEKENHSTEENLIKK